MQSQKSERSYQDYLSVCESDFLNTYFLQIVGDAIPSFFCQSELEMRHKLKESKLDIPAMLQQKKSLYVKPNRFVFANCDFQLEEAMNQIKAQIQKYDYQDEEKKSSSTRKKLYKSLITSSFSDDIPICQVNSWVVLNDVKLNVKRGDVIVFIVKIKASSYTLNRLQTLIYNEIQYTKSKLVDYCSKYQPKLHPILILNADINFPYQKLNCQAYYVGKQNLMYHFFQQMRVKNTSEAITEAFITKHNINRMSQSRLMLHKWENDYKSQLKKNGLFKVATFGIAISLGLVLLKRFLK